MSEKLPWPSHWPSPEEREDVLRGWATALVNGSGGNAYEYACLAHAYLTQKKDAELDAAIDAIIDTEVPNG